MARYFVGSNYDISVHNPGLPLVSFELFDKISTEDGLSLKLLNFVFYFERKTF